MEQIDVIVRVAAATLLVGLAALLLDDRRRGPVAWLFLLFALGVAGFLAGNTPDQGLLLTGPAAWAASLLSGLGAIFLWWFALAVFDDEFRLGPIELGVGAAWLAVALVDRGVLPSPYAGQGLSWVLVAMAATMVAHVSIKLARDMEGDFVEARRRARWILAAVLASFLLLDVGADILMGFDWKPQGFSVAQNVAILVVAAGMGRWLLRVDMGALTFGPVSPSPAGGGGAVPTATPGERRLLDRLDSLMSQERLHRDPDLTFAVFASRLGAPEPEVRRLINQRLGHRHFRSFLNTWRVADARAALADPARRHDKMIAVAFDVGFGSLASFNRVFSQAEGRPPSVYRDEVLAAGAAPQSTSEERLAEN